MDAFTGILSKLPPDLSTGVLDTTDYSLYPHPYLVAPPYVATSNPFHIEKLQNFSVLYKQPLRLAYLPADQISAITAGANGHTMQEALEEITDSELQFMAIDDSQAPTEDVLADLAQQAPVVRLVNTMFTEAYTRGASDIHLEQGADGVGLRYRIDGLLYDQPKPPHNLFPAMVSRVKILAGLNIAEKRLPQDGRIRIRLGRNELDIRVATTPTIHGESITLRLLDKGRGIRQLSELGMQQAMQHVVEELLSESNGIILVTGPTGCGKTTTLYAALEKVRSPDRKIITLEDPVEYEVAGVTQIQVKPKIGLTFAAGLRSILRHDPDVLLVGEIRDRETADMAIHASMTGHLVLASLHTNDAISAINRLLDLGVESFLLSSTIRAVLAQRLVRVLCHACKKPTGNKSEPFLPAGCPRCDSIGYKGRTAIFELLICDPKQNDLAGINDTSLWRNVAQGGGSSLLDNGKEKVAAGITTFAELERAIGRQALQQSIGDEP